ncbi:ATP-binding protein [Saccharopolyspora rosea]
MLRSFRLGNHRSFLEEQELLLMPAIERGRSVLPVTAVYGANASGKSNLLDGLAFMRTAVRDSFRRWDAHERIPRRRFRLTGGAADTPSVFVAEFQVDGVPYTYGFSLDDRQVLEEWLYSYPEKRRRIMFDRDRGEIRFGSKISESSAKLDVLKDMTRENALLLSVAVQLNVGFADRPYSFFSEALSFSGPFRDDSPQLLNAFIERGEGNRRRVVDLLRAADLGITDLVVERARAESALARSMRQEFENDPESFARSAARAGLDVKNLEDLDLVLAELQDFRVKTMHVGGEVPFDLSDESHGTRSWLRLIPTALEALDHGSVLLVDEIDSSLHPLLTARLIGLFRDERTNPRSAQLIFTTHDTSLLGTMLNDEVLKRDEVWFVSKNDAGASELYALSDFRPRSGENTERRYLKGSYGAVPLLDHQNFVAAARGER